MNDDEDLGFNRAVLKLRVDAIYHYRSERLSERCDD